MSLNSVTAAVPLRMAELLLFSVILFAVAAIGSISSDAYDITRYTQFYEISRAIFVFSLSPMYLLAALFLSVRSVTDDRILVPFFFWITPSILCFFAYNLFISSFLPTASLLVASSITILLFKKAVGSVK